MEKALTYNKWGSAKELSYGEIPKPLAIDPETVKLGSNEILLKVEFISINPIDWKILSGSQKLVASGSFPRVFGTDFSGIVFRSGSSAGKKGFIKGVSVAGMVSPLNNGSGRKWLIVKADHCIILPDEISLEKGASFPEAGVSAMEATKFSSKKKSGNVLVLGASGGVGSIAVQILKHRGWNITALCRKNQQSSLEKLGCTHFIERSVWEDELYNQPLWDAIVDCPGAIIRKKVSRFLKPGGVYSPVYIPDDFIPRQILRVILWFFSPYTTSIFIGYPSKTRMKRMKKLIYDRIIIPIVDTIGKAEDISSLVEKSQKGGLLGKIIVSLD